MYFQVLVYANSAVLYIRKFSPGSPRKTVKTKSDALPAGNLCGRSV